MAAKEVNTDLALFALIARMYGNMAESLGLWDAARDDPAPGAPVDPSQAQAMLNAAGVRTIYAESDERECPHWLRAAANAGRPVLCRMKKAPGHAGDFWGVLETGHGPLAGVISLGYYAYPEVKFKDWRDVCYGEYVVAVDPIPGWEDGLLWNVGGPN